MKGEHLALLAGLGMGAGLAAFPPSGYGRVTGFTLAVWMLLGTWIAVIDAREHRIPNKLAGLMSVATLGGVVVAVATGADSLLLGKAILSATIASLVALVVHLASSASLGMGDVKLVFPLVLGLAPFGGETVWTALVVTVLLANVMLAIRAVLRVGQRPIPLAPYLVAGAGIALLWA